MKKVCRSLENLRGFGGKVVAILENEMSLAFSVTVKPLYQCLINFLIQISKIESD